MSGGTKAGAAWEGLNERQRLYLSTVLDFDQAAEVEIKRQSAQWMKTPPAAEWRQITYDIKLPKEISGYSSVQSVLRRAGQHDPGSGSSLAALERRGLVQVTHDRVYIPPFGNVPRIRVRLTPLGRATARVGKGITAPATPPKGLMARWSFAALARLYAAGEDGLVLHARDTPSWNTLLKLRDRKDGSFIDEFGRGRVRLSVLGRRHYELHRACYRELYPDIDTPEPAERVEGAHGGLADHRVRRPRHLVRETDLPVLAKLAALEAKDACHLRRVVAEKYERLGQEVPEEVRAIPSGLLRWQVKNLTRTDKSINRLATHPGGPLIEVIDTPNGPFHRDTHPTVPLIVLTDHGRAHYARHLPDYREAHPERDIPDHPDHWGVDVRTG
ncbi:hypothetical protein [Actinokineospora sp.]|uniref:hypothetical protein n=1 Tax=Actinokineospora sp. TaxID=1872133 RepID=UPI003D6BD308